MFDMEVWVMSLSAKQRERFQDVVLQLREIVGGCLHEDGRPMTFAELEEECIEAGDFLTATVLQQRVAQKETPQEAPCCPTCQRQGTPQADDEVRVLQTDRGEVSWMEPAYYCCPCRRSFFPSLG
jgi:hypothetical protein